MISGLRVSPARVEQLPNFKYSAFAEHLFIPDAGGGRHQRSAGTRPPQTTRHHGRRNV